MENYTSFRPGKVWLDTNGNRIQAHGGSVIIIDDTFYWYGENKEKTKGYGGIWHLGVRLYSSKDLYNWKDEGVIMQPEFDDEDSPLHPNSQMDRPHILYNDSTGKFVMWMKIMGKNDVQYMVTASSDSIKGPFKIINKMLHPCGMKSGDFDLVKLDDGRALIVFERVHTDMIAMELTYDYLDVTDKYSAHYYRKCPPYVREAPAVFFRDKKGYIITSGTTSYFPNRSEAASFDDIHGEWTVLGDSHVNDIKNTSFDSQISCIFRHPHKKDLYIAMADRWLTDLTDDLPDMDAVYATRFDPDYEGEKIYVDEDNLSAYDTSKADYVWLPIAFRNGRPYIEWHDEWKLEDYE